MIVDRHQQAPELLMLPFGFLRLLKPCKVKRFLAPEDLSMGGLVAGSSGNHSVKWKCGWKRSVGISPVEERHRKMNHGVEKVKKKVVLFTTGRDRLLQAASIYSFTANVLTEYKEARLLKPQTLLR